MDSLKFKTGFTIFAVLFTAMFCLDLYVDYQNKTDTLHLVLEIALMLLVIVTTIYLWVFFRKDIIKKQTRIDSLDQKLSHFQNEYKDALSSLSQGILKQLDHWKLSASEKKVAIALIRGYPIKQIAAILNRQERTIRNQATSIYDKTQMTGRNDLAAFFLSEILPDPDDETDEK